MTEHETFADVIAWLRRPKEGENGYLTLWRDEIADRLEAAHKRELQDALDCGGIVGAAHEREVATNMRSKLYGLAGSIHALIARSDARERGVHYTEVQNIAAQIENIADNGGEA